MVGEKEGGGLYMKLVANKMKQKRKKIEKKKKINSFTRLVVTRCDVLDMKKYCSLYRGRMGHMTKCL